MRDPLARFRSIFTAYHYDNASHRRRKDRRQKGEKSREHQKTCSKCFPSLEDFATAADGATSNNTTAPLTNHADCSMIPEALFQYQKRFSDHWYWNHDTVWRNVLNANPFFDSAIVLSLRTEHRWGDWISANHYLGQSEVILPSNITQERAYGLLYVPVSTHL